MMISLSSVSLVVVFTKKKKHRCAFKSGVNINSQVCQVDGFKACESQGGFKKCNHEEKKSSCISLLCSHFF